MNWQKTKVETELLDEIQTTPSYYINSFFCHFYLAHSLIFTSKWQKNRIKNKTKLYNSCAWRKDLDGCGKTSRLQSNHDSTFSLFLIARKKNIFFLPLRRYKHTSYKFPSERSEEKRQWGNAKKTRKKEGNKIEKVCENQLSGDVRRAGESFRESVCKAAEMLRQRQKEKSKKSAGALKSFNKTILARARYTANYHRTLTQIFQLSSRHWKYFSAFIRRSLLFSSMLFLIASYITQGSGCRLSGKRVGWVAWCRVIRGWCRRVFRVPSPATWPSKESAKKGKGQKGGKN